VTFERCQTSLIDRNVSSARGADPRTRARATGKTGLLVSGHFDYRTGTTAVTISDGSIAGHTAAGLAHRRGLARCRPCELSAQAHVIGRARDHGRHSGACHGRHSRRPTTTRGPAVSLRRLRARHARDLRLAPAYAPRCATAPCCWSMSVMRRRRLSTVTRSRGTWAPGDRPRGHLGLAGTRPIGHPRSLCCATGWAPLCVRRPSVAVSCGSTRRAGRVAVRGSARRSPPESSRVVVNRRRKVMAVDSSRERPMPSQIKRRRLSSVGRPGAGDDPAEW